MSFLCPNCCLNIFRSSSKSKKSIDTFAQPQHAQLIQDENQKIMKKQTITTLPDQYFDENNKHKNLMDQINVQLNLDNQNTIKNVRKGSKQSKKVQQEDLIGSNEQKITKNNNQNDNQNQEQGQNNQDNDQHNDDYVPSQQQLIPNYSKFSINIDPYDKHYQTLHEKTSNLDKYFVLSQNIQLLLDLSPHKSNLKIHRLNSQMNKFNIKLELPCSYSYYTQLMKDSNINNKKHMILFQRYQILQSFKPNFTKNLARFKRFNVIQPRQFIYYKYSNGSYKQNWQICFSDSSQQIKKQHSPNSAHFETKQCEILSVSNYKQIHQQLYIQQYLQIDIKVNNLNNHIWSKIINQVKQYYQNLYLYISKNYQKELL